MAGRHLNLHRNRYRGFSEASGSESFGQALFGCPPTAATPLLLLKMRLRGYPSSASFRFEGIVLMHLAVLLLPLVLCACVSFSSSSPPPPANNTTIIVPPGSTVIQ
jgi:hypothetical protein